MTTLTVKKNKMFDSLFNDVFDDFFGENHIARPYTDRLRRNFRVLNNDDDWQIAFAVPGVKKGDVNVKIDNNILTVSYDNKVSNSNVNFVSSFAHSWTVENDVDVEKIVANHEDGILTVTIPKPETKKRIVRTIAIN